MDGFVVPCFRQRRLKIFEKNSLHGCSGKAKREFCLQNSRQESENPRKDFRFHVFGNAKAKKIRILQKKLLLQYRETIAEGVTLRDYGRNLCLTLSHKIKVDGNRLLNYTN